MRRRKRTIKYPTRIKVRELMRRPYAWEYALEHALTPHELHVYNYAMDKYDKRPLADIAREMGVTRETPRALLKRLLDYGFITYAQLENKGRLVSDSWKIKKFEISPQFKKKLYRHWWEFMNQEV